MEKGIYFHSSENTEFASVISCNSYEGGSRIEKKEIAARVSTNQWIKGYLRA